MFAADILIWFLGVYKMKSGFEFKLVVEKSETLRIRHKRVTEWCTSCGREVELVSAEDAATAKMGLRRSTRISKQDRSFLSKCLKGSC